MAQRVGTPPSLPLSRGSQTARRPTTPNTPVTPGRSTTPVVQPSTPHTGRDNHSTGSTQNITVAVRVRKFQEGENADLAVRMNKSTCEVHVPHRGRFPFSFDKCFWSNNVEDAEKPYSSQEDVFEKLGKPLVDNALLGFNSSIIAYGQTGSGKTYSIFGRPDSLNTEDEGLIPRVCKDIFSRLSSPPPGVQHKVYLSIVEVYLEDVYDLLQKRKELKVRGDSSGFSVVGLKTSPVSSYGDVLKLLRQAESQKTFAATAIHDRSSRAHTLFQLEVRSITNKTTRTARVVLADLAGSERVKEAQTDTGLSFEQAKNINLSLLNLGTCIEAVVSRCKNGQGIQNIGEFRSSTLTKLLKDFIGGNSRTSMLVTIAPSSADVNHTLQSLRFADRAKQITCHAVINTEVNTDAHQVKEQIAKMFQKKRELLDKECELEMQTTIIRKKQADLEKLSYDLMEERRRLHEQSDQVSADERQRRQKRESEIEARLQLLQRELSEAETQRDALDERYLEMVKDQQALQQDKDQISADHARLLEEFDNYKTEVMQQTMTMQMEHAQVVAKLDDQLKQVEKSLAEHKATARARADALAVEHTRQLSALTMEHDESLATARGELKDNGDTWRKRLITLEEELFEKTRSLTEKETQCETLAIAHTRSAANIATLDEKLSELTLKYSEERKRAEDLDDRMLELSETHTTVLAAKAKSSETLEEQNSLIAQLKKQLKESAENFEAQHRLSEAKEKMSNELTKKNVSFEEKNMELELQCRDIMDELSETSKTLQTKENEVAHLKEALAESTDKLKASEQKTIEVQSQFQRLEAVLDEEATTHNATKRKLSSTLLSLEETESQWEEFKHTTKDGEKKALVLQGRIEDLQAALSSEISCHDATQKKMSSTQMTLEETQIQTQEAAKDNEKKFADLQGRIHELEAALEEESSAHSLTKRKLSATLVSLDEAEAQWQHASNNAQSELNAEKKNTLQYRRRYYTSRNACDVIRQQCVAAQNALNLALQQQTFADIDEENLDNSVHFHGSTHSGVFHNSSSVGGTCSITPNPHKQLQFSLSPVPNHPNSPRHHTQTNATHHTDPLCGQRQQQHQQQRHHQGHQQQPLSPSRSVNQQQESNSSLSPPSSPLRTALYVG